MSTRPGHGGKKLVSTTPGGTKIGSLSSPTNVDKLLGSSTGSLDSEKPALGKIKKEPPSEEPNVAPLNENENEPGMGKSSEKEEEDAMPHRG